MSDEILSKRTIAVLLVLSMLLSVFGTLAVINYLQDYEPPIRGLPQQLAKPENERAGQLTLEIMPPPREISTTGYIALDIQQVEP